MLIAVALHLFSRKGRIIIVDPTFFMITRIAESLGTKLLKIKLAMPSFSLPVEPLIDEAKDSAIVVIDNPNNPTGKLLIGKNSVDELCRSSSGVVLIDESYYEFSHFSVIDMTKSHPNLIVARTMSKAFGLAGLKVGYLVAGEAVLEAFSSLDLPLRPTTPSVCAAMEALKDMEYMERNVELVTKERKRVRREASRIGVEVYPSSTNFLLMRTSVPNAAKKLKELRIIVFDASNQLSSEFIRVSIGTYEENNVFLSSLKEITNLNVK
jgi:histidinol-phosphate aminotransferase